MIINKKIKEVIYYSIFFIKTNETYYDEKKV